jgi:hypothetical protein
MKSSNKKPINKPKLDIKTVIIIVLLAIIGVHFLSHSSAASTNLQPLKDVNSDNVIGVGKSASSLYKDVSEGTTFTSSDNNSSYIRGENGVNTSSNTLQYFTLPGSATLSGATVNIRAYKGSASSGSLQVQLYNGTKLIGTGPVHKLSSSYANYSDKFTGLSIKGASLRTKVLLHNNGQEGAVRYTLIWVSAQIGGTVTPPPPDTGDVTPPSVPTGVKAALVSSTGNSVKVTWNPSTDNAGGSGMKQYGVARTDPSGTNNAIFVVPAGTTTYTDNSTVSGVTYTYTVYAEDKASNLSKPSAPSTVSTPGLTSPDKSPPNVPVATAKVVSPTQVTISWNAVTDNPPGGGASGVRGYIVFRNGTQIANVTTTSTNDGPFIFASGTSYKYTVLAYDAAGNKSAQSAPSSVIPNPSGGGGTGSVCGNPATGNKIDTVIVIAEENRTWSGGNTPGVGLGFSTTNMPYVHQIAAQCTYFTQDTETNTSDNSAQQYVGAWTGYPASTSHVSGDCTPSTSCSYTGNNIFRVFRAAGIPHREYVEGATSTCSSSGNATKHIPDMYMWNAADRAACSSEVLPLSQFSFASPPTGFTFITPTLCNDGHDCSDSTVNTWLGASTRLPALFNSAAYKSGKVLVDVWWDEDHPRPNLFACYSCNKSVSTVDPHFSGESKLWLDLLGASTANLGAISNGTDIRGIVGTP